MLNHYPVRRAKVQQQLRPDSLDGILVSNPINVSYLTGFTGDSSYLVLSQDKAVLISDGRFTTQIEEECPGLEFHIRPPAQMIQGATGNVLKQMGLRSVAFEASHLTIADFQTLADSVPEVNWNAERGRIEQLRTIKDDWELDQIKAAIRMAESAFTTFRGLLRAGLTEKELTDSMEMLLRRAGAKCSSFPSIVAAGERAALPHANPTARRVDQEALLLVDWGASGTFYKSDLTRVLLNRTKSTSFSSKGGNSSGPELPQVYDIVLRAQQQAIAVLRPGVKTGDVDAAARRVITEAGFGDQFTHSIGHGIGMQVHEGPILRPGTEVPLQPGMVVTIEPGIYVPGWGGIRIEDDVLITTDGYQVLTTLAKDMESQWVDYQVEVLRHGPPRQQG